MRVLLLSNLGTDLGDPFFRFGAYKGYLLPLAQSLLRAGADPLFLASRQVSERLASVLLKESFPAERSYVFDGERGLSAADHDFMIESYRGSISEPRKVAIKAAVLSSLPAGWVPDVIMSWEAPTYLLREIYPEALVLDLMPGMFARPPYPQMLSFDPVGLYRDCWFAGDAAADVFSDEGAMADYHRLKGVFKSHFDALDSSSILSSEVLRAKRKTLLPLQISEYFAWKDNVRYEGQYAYLEDVLSHAAGDEAVIATQYVAGFIEEKVINENNHGHLRSEYPSFYYDPKFEKMDNISQFLLPHVDTVNTVSSTLGLQAKFHGKRLVSPSTSHLSYIADSPNISDPVKNLDSFMCSFLGRTQFVKKRLEQDPQYFLSLLQSFLRRRGRSGIEQFPSFGEVGNTFSELMSHSKLDSNKGRFEKAFGRSPSRSEQLLQNAKDAHLKDHVDTVSFDVFDTLVCRTVFHPRDVFLLMEARLKKEFSQQLPANLVESFAQIREGSERALRNRMDSQPEAEREEMRIDEVYQFICERFGVDGQMVSTLISVEQEMELGVLRPRPVGMELFTSAISSGKRVVIISDFIHPTEFVERVLRACGYSGWDQLYVSSDAGVKKHSGRLFAEVCRSSRMQPEKTVHYGDNPHGDIEMAQASGIEAVQLTAGPALMKQVWTGRKFSYDAINKSFVTRSILCAYANRFFGIGGSRTRGNGAAELISNHKEFGYLIPGPIMTQFAEWVMQKAEEVGVDQVLFFARDTSLPYRMLKEVWNAEERGVKVCYVPVSRSAVACCDVEQPSDAIKVGISDYKQTGTLSELLRDRFSLNEAEIDLDAVFFWTGDRRTDLRWKDVPEMGIFEVARLSYEKSWGVVSKRLDLVRSKVRHAMLDAGVDFDRACFAVDFGYRGTIHKRVRNLFHEAVIPVFFMTYADDLGGSPMKDALVFWQENLNMRVNTGTPFKRHNLMLETIINEPEGSVLGYRYDRFGLLSVVRDDDITEQHKADVAAIHEGALEFARDWRSNSSGYSAYASLEPTMLDFLFGLVTSAPNKVEAKLLQNLVFDNGYSGHRIKKIVNPGNLKASIWREGAVVLKEGGGSQKARSRGPVRPNDQRSLVKNIEGVLVQILVNDAKYGKYLRNRVRFYEDSILPATVRKALIAVE